MKDKLEPNMYVRLNCNYTLGIGKTIEEIDEDNFIKTKFKDGFECSLPTYIINKASHNIIDLFEVGDYVNGWKVLYWTDGTKVVDDGYATNLDKISVKSIVTKEQFESMKYEVK